MRQSRTTPGLSPFAAAAAALILAGSASAHDTYLLPENFTSPAPVAISLTSAEKFPTLGYGIKKARVAKVRVDGPDAAASLKPLAETATALKLSLKAKKPGTYVASVELPAHDIDLTPDQVAEYFAEIDAPPSLRAAYDALPEPRHWKESYTKYAKTVVCVASCTPPVVLARPMGLKVEFVAVAESLGTDKPKFRLLNAGAPLRDAAVAVFRHDGARTVQHTDQDGAVALPPGLTGPVLLSAVIIAAPKNAGARFTSDFATLTFDAAVVSAP